jgi:hypothetical protein
VELEVDDDVLTVRTSYGRAQPNADDAAPLCREPVANRTPKARSIGVNRLSTPSTSVHHVPPDVLTSNVLTGRVSKIRRATVYIAEGVADDLRTNGGLSDRRP